MTATAASSPCIPTSCSASGIIISRKSSTSIKDRNGYTLDTDLDADDWPEWSRATRSASRRRRGKPFPQDPHAQLWGAIGAVFGSLDEPARHHLSAAARHSGKLGHCGQCAGHGVRQYGRDFGHRGRFHPQSVDRREKALRRVSDQRAGRGRGRRHPHAAGDHRSGAQGSRLRQAVDGSGAAGCLRRAQAHPRQARTALPRHAGSRIHGRAGQAVDAADAQRQAHGAGGAAHRRRTGAGED